MAKSIMVALVERNKAIYQMRESGATFREVGEHFGISGGRVQVICRWYERYKARRLQEAELLEAAAKLRTEVTLGNLRVISSGFYRLIESHQALR